MKKVFLLSAFMIFAATNEIANASSNIGQCVYPKTKSAPKGRIEFINPISIYKALGSTEFEILKEFRSFTVKAESKGFIQLVTVPDYSLADPDKTAGKVVGWAKLSEFKLVDLRNCN